MKVGFIVWNPFQLIQFETIASKVETPTIFIIDKENNLSLFPKELLSSRKWKIEYIKPKDIPIIDGTHDILLFQSAFPNIEKIRLSKLVSVQYGLAKERHNYGEWRSLADMNLMYGDYSSNIVSHYSPSYSVGNPKFDEWESYESKYSNREELYKELNLDFNKKTILYMPTWGDLGSYFDLLDSISQLQSHYNIVLKMHHNNDAKTPEWVESANAASLKHVFDGSADQLKLICAADLIISDFSGAIFDGVYAKKPILLYQAGIEHKVGMQKFDLDSLEFLRRDDIGHVCMDISDFEESIDYCLKNPYEIMKKSAELRKEIFHKQADKNASQICVEYLFKLHNGEIPELSKTQLYVRETVQSLRTARPKINRLEKIIKNRSLPLYKKAFNFIARKNH